MSTLFTKIIDGEIPGRFVWKDEDLVAFLTIGPLTDGHTLVVPRQEVDHWIDADNELLLKMTTVAQTIGQAQREAFPCERIGMTIVGFEIPHLHMHVWPTNSMADFDFSQVEQNPDPQRLDANAQKLRGALRDAGHSDVVPEA